MKLFKSLFEPVDKWLWSFLCKNHLILFCSDDAPEAPNLSKQAGKYLFGKDFTSYSGITDPLLQGRLLESEETYRPLFSGLELADINTFASGLKEGTPNPEYGALEREISQLEADIAETRTKKNGKVVPVLGSGKLKKAQKRLKEAQTRLTSIEPTMTPQKGLLELLEDQARSAGDLQREQLELQRDSDVKALETYGSQVVDAYRQADPRSADLADFASLRAGMTRDADGNITYTESDLLSKGRGLMNSELRSASEAEEALRSQGLSNINAKRAAASAAQTALQASGLSNINAQREAASAAEQELNKVGMSLSDLSPTEQEALLSGRGMEFAASTGELTPLEQRRAQQSSREASISRGRGMDQSAIYGEMQARMAAELDKQGREVALGAKLLGQQSEMRLNRLGQGASVLGQAEAMNAQRRAEQLQRQQFGATSLNQVELMNAQLRREQLQRQELGASMLGQAETAEAQRRADQLKQIQMGSQLFGQAQTVDQRNLGQAFEMNRLMAGDLGSAILGRPSSAIQLGGQILDAAQTGASQELGPNLFDMSPGINAGMQMYQNQAQSNIANQASQGNMMSGLAPAAGSLAGSAAGSLSSAAGSLGSAAIGAI